MSDNKVLDLFSQVSTKGVSARKGESYEALPKGTYFGYLTGLELKADGMKWSDANGEHVKPTAQFILEVAHGPLAGRKFYDEKYIVNNDDPSELSEAAQAARERDIGRFLGFIEVVTGTATDDLGAGFQLVLETLESYGGRVPVKFKITHGKPNKKGYTPVRALAMEQWTEADLPSDEA